METIIVKKSKGLSGHIEVDGSKNSILPILAATLLTEEKCIIHNMPKLEDVTVMLELLESLGASVNRIDDATVEIEAKEIKKWEAPYELIVKMRASFLVVGPLLARINKAKASLPGGCAIGNRPINMHLKGFKSLNVDIEFANGFVFANTDGMVGNYVYLDFPSVGATENLIMAASMAKGKTVIENVAEEPEIVDLANFINKMGGSVRGAGTRTITVNGVDRLHGAEHRIIPDRIEAGTYMVAAAVTGGELYVDNIEIDHIQPIIAKLREIGVEVVEKEKGVLVKGTGELKPTDLKTLPYPGFPTDMQAQFMALLSVASGTSIINETIFENRFMHVDEFRRMGADIKIEGNIAVINGCKLTGARVKATDLRAGAALILAGLAAEGETQIQNTYHIKRGYAHIVEKLQKVGANISVKDVE